jgi:hypothetical protein
MMSCIRIIGNFIAVNDHVCKKLVYELGLLDVLKTVLVLGTKDHKKETFWLLSNIAANNEEEAIIIIKKGLLTNLIYGSKDTNLNIRREAIWTISNICAVVQDAKVLNELIMSDVLTLFYDLLIYDHDLGQLMMLTLSGLDHLLKKSPIAKNLFE